VACFTSSGVICSWFFISYSLTASVNAVLLLHARIFLLDWLIFIIFNCNCDCDCVPWFIDAGARLAGGGRLLGGDGTRLAGGGDCLPGAAGGLPGGGARLAGGLPGGGARLLGDGDWLPGAAGGLPGGGARLLGDGDWLPGAAGSDDIYNII